MKTTILSKLLKFTLPILIAPLLLMTFFYYVYLNKVLVNEIVFFQKSAMKHLSYDAKNLLNKQEKHKNLNPALLFDVIIFDAKMNTLLKNTDSHLTDIFTNAILKTQLKNETKKIYHLDQEMIMVMPIYVDDKIKAFVVSSYEKTIQNKKKTLNQTFTFFLVILLFVLFISISFLTIFSFKLTRPLKQLMKGIQQISNGDTTHTIKSTTNDEFEYLIESFNEMNLKRADAEETLQNHHDFLQTIINSVDESIMVINKDYTVSMMNEHAKRMMDEKLIVDKNNPRCHELSHYQQNPCEGHQHPCPLLTVLETKEKTKVTHKHRNIDGEEKTIEVLASPLFDKNGEVYGVVEFCHDITELQKVQNDLQHQAEHDILTNLPNRLLLQDRLNQSIKYAQRTDTKVLVLFLDLDNFKEVNDSLGHTIGDELLQIVAKKLQNVVLEDDTVARLGGDEFCIILNEVTDVETSISIIQKLNEEMRKVHILNNDQQIFLTTSIGVSVYPDDALDAETILKNSDAAMYQAKNNGRDNYQFYTQDMTKKAYERIQLETSLRQAIDEGELEVYYQKQIDARDMSIVGMEALVRWKHPQIGMIPPSKFIPIAESSGFIVQIDNWVMEQAIAQFSSWYAQGLEPGKLSLNLSSIQLKNDKFLQNVKTLLSSYSFQTSWLMFEITESQVIKNFNEAILVLNELKELGIKLSLDDFGTGYSSLSYLKKLPIDKIKIDRSFITELAHNHDDIAMVQTIIAMAKSLHLDIIAEGVETSHQHDFLLDHGCEHIQGFFYHEPSSASQINFSK